MKRFFTLLFSFSLFCTFAAPPTVPSSNLSFFTIDGAFFNLGWSAGNGARRVMVAKAGSAPTFIPENGVDYDANTIFGQGQEVAPGEFIVYDHASFSYFLTGLTPATTYYFRMFEYNGTGGSTEYLTSSYLSGSGSTSAAPTVQTSNATFSNITTNSLTVSFTMGNGQRRLIVAREGAPVDADPVDNVSYNGANSVFGTGTELGEGNYAVYRSSSNATTISNLKAGTEYFFAFYELNGNQQPQFLRPGYTASVTTRSMPTVASSDLSIWKTDGKELTLTWTKGNGQRRIIIAKQGSEVTSLPANGTDYNASAVFGQGQQLAAGEYVVYNNNFNATTVSGLTPGTTYHFKIFEYDGTGSGTAYLTSTFAALGGATATTPTVQTQVQTVSNISSNSVRLNFTTGNGRARFVIGRKDAPVNVDPVDFTTYTEDVYFGQGQNLGNGNFAVSTTNANALTVQNLQPGSTYHFAIYELNGFNQPLYFTPAVRTNATTLAALPVTLVNWEAIATGNKVYLKWRTGTEENSSHFVVERSADGSLFTPVVTVSAAGNSATGKQYSATDEQPIEGKSYYRLKMFDVDGQWEYSAVRQVTINIAATVRLLENPVHHRLLVMSSAGKRTEWAIVGVTGQVLSKGILTEGRNDINVSVLAPGSYRLQLADKHQTSSIPFVKY